LATRQWSPVTAVFRSAYDARPRPIQALNVFVVSASGGTPQPLTSGSANARRPVARRALVYFARSRRRGEQHLEGCFLRADSATQSDAHGGVFALEIRRTGKWLFTLLRKAGRFAGCRSKAPGADYVSGLGIGLGAKRASVLCCGGPGCLLGPLLTNVALFIRF